MKKRPPPPVDPLPPPPVITRAPPPFPGWLDWMFLLPVAIVLLALLVLLARALLAEPEVSGVLI